MNCGKPVPAWFSLILSVVVVVMTGFSDEDSRYRRISEALQRFSYLYIQQKAFLHLDKHIYHGGDNMWIKAYLVNGTDHLPDTLSTNLYVELISPSQTRIEIKRFQMFRGSGTGDFRLSDTLPEGLYQIRAFTGWMQNFDPDFYFKQNFQLFNPGYRRLISPRQAKVNRKELDDMEKMAADFDLQFMPEGGALVNGLESVVGFKVVNKLGKGTDIEGSIVDDQGNRVTTFKSFYKGIGTFKLKPEKGRKYFAIIPDEGREFRAQLPQAMETGVVLHVEDQPDRILLSLQTNHPPTADPNANEIILTGQVGGRIYYHDILTFENNQTSAVISKTKMPGGIVQLTAFSGRGEPLAERLVFVNRLNFMNINFNAIDTLTDEGRKICLDIATADRYNKPLPANLSLSVTREINRQYPHNNENIISNLLLTSDLKGYIEDPLGYFRNQLLVTRTALDNLMLTQGWRRFDWSKILEGEYPKIRYHEERGLTVLGQITREFFGIPLKDCKVQLTIMDEYNDVFTRLSGEKGYFLFDNMVYYDTISVKIEAWRQSGRRNLVILLPVDETTEVLGQTGDYQLTTLSERDNRAYRYEKSAEAREALKAEQEQYKKERMEAGSIYGEPDFVLRSKDIPSGSRDIVEVMKGRVPGMIIMGDQIIIRGPGSLLGSNQPLFLIDGVPTRDIYAIKSIPVEEIERVEVLKGANAAIFGVRGSNGVIAVYTKRGQFMKKGVLEFDMLGYHRPRVFYQPKYLPENEPIDNYTLLWVPVVHTDNSGKARIVFDKPPVSGDYRFIIQGISYEGHVGFEESVIVNQ